MTLEKKIDMLTEFLEELQESGVYEPSDWTKIQDLLGLFYINNEPCGYCWDLTCNLTKASPRNKYKYCPMCGERIEKP